MHLAEIDQISINGNSPLHKAGTVSKILLTIFILAGLIISKDVIRLGGLMAILFVFFIIGRIPLIQIGHLALYPAFFSIIFALIRGQESWILGLIVILKAVGAAFTMLLLITTTPYVDIFSFLSLFMPSLLVDIFIFTYRSFFILMDQIQNLLKSMRLRGGYKSFNIFTNLRNIAGIIGTLIIHSFEMSERMYKIYSLRGYSGKLPLQREIGPLKTIDYMIIFSGLITLIGVMIPWRP